MKISEVTLDTLKVFSKISYDMDELEEAELLGFFEAAKGIVRVHTGLSAEQCDEHAELTVAVLILTADMFDRREAFMKVSEAAPNKTLERILALHDFNLL